MLTGDYNRKLVAVAQSYVGQRETARNSGPMVDIWLSGVGLGPGYAWCAAALYGWAFEAASSFNLACPCPRTAGALRMWQLTERAHVATPAPGSLFAVDHGHGMGHVGIVETVSPNGKVTEVSGNTNAQGSREGDSVARHTWSWREPTVHGGRLLGFADLELLIPADAFVAAGLPKSPF